MAGIVDTCASPRAIEGGSIVADHDAGASADAVGPTVMYAKQPRAKGSSCQWVLHTRGGSTRWPWRRPGCLGIGSTTRSDPQSRFSTAAGPAATVSSASAP